MYLKIQGLVLRRTEYNDHDVLLTILSNQHGKITAKARGLKRKNSPLTAQCQLLAFAEFTLFEYRGICAGTWASCPLAPISPRRRRSSARRICPIRSCSPWS